MYEILLAINDMEMLLITKTKKWLPHTLEINEISEANYVLKLKS